MTLPGFQQLLAELRHNISRTRSERTAAITQIRKEKAAISIAATLTTTSWGPTYYVHPAWNTENLVSWWTLASFESVAGTGGVRDSFGSTNGTINGDPSTSTYDDITKGRKRHFMVFDGTGDFVNLGDITALDGAAAITFGFRLRQSQADLDAGRGTLLARWPSANGDKQFIIQSKGTTGIEVTIATNASGGTSTGENSGPIFAADTWHDVTVVYDGGGAANADRLKIYIDGSNQSLSFTGTMPTSLQAVADDLLIGRKETATAEDYTGDLYDVIYWNDDLTASEVSAWSTDAITNRMTAGYFRMPGTLVVNITPTKSDIAIPAKRRNLKPQIQQHQLTMHL
jgi:hypothetical protein